MNDNYYKNLEEEGESYRDSYRDSYHKSYHTTERAEANANAIAKAAANATTKANTGWFQKFNPRNFMRNYAMWILICIIKIVIIL